MADPRPNESQAEVLLELGRWLSTAQRGARVLYGPGGADASEVVEQLATSTAAAAFRALRIQLGPRHGICFARDFELQLAAAFWPSEGPFTDEAAHLRQRVLNHFWRWPADDEPPLLLLVSDLDLCADARVAGALWGLGPLGESVRAVFSLAGDRDAATEWVERLRLPESGVAYVALASEPATDAALLGARTLALSGSGELGAALGVLAASLEPMSLMDLAQVLGVDEQWLGREIETAPEPLQGLLELEQPQALRFRTRALQTTWAALAEPSSRAGARRLNDAAVACVASGAAAPSRYLRRNAVAHLFVNEAPTALLLRACEPEWAWPSSLPELVERRSDLEHVRLRCTERACEQEELAALVGLTAVALAQGAHSSLLELDWLSGARRLCGPAEQASLFAARRALARHASPSLAAQLLTTAREKSLFSYRDWSDARELLELAELHEPELAATVARLAVTALRSDELGLHGPLTLRAAHLLPAAESAALLAETVARLCSAPEPGKAMGTLLQPASKAETVRLDAAELAALFQASLTLPRASSANALAVLFDRLTGSQRDTARAAIYRALLDDEEAPSEELAGPEPLDAALCLQAVAASLSEPQLLALVDNPRWSGLGDALARRLAELGHGPRVAQVIASYCGGGLYAARAWLPASEAATDHQLDSPTLAVLASLSEDQLVGLVIDFPAPMLRLLGLTRALELVRTAPDSSGYARVAALAALCWVADEAARGELAELTAQAYLDDWDTDALALVVKVSAWLTPGTAVRLYVSAIGVVADTRGLVVALQGWGSIEQLAPLLARSAGDPVLLAVSDVLELVERWDEHPRDTDLTPWV